MDPHWRSNMAHQGCAAMRWGQVGGCIGWAMKSISQRINMSFVYADSLGLRSSPDHSGQNHLFVNRYLISKRLRPPLPEASIITLICSTPFTEPPSDDRSMLN